MTFCVYDYNIKEAEMLNEFFGGTRSLFYSFNSINIWTSHKRDGRIN